MHHYQRVVHLRFLMLILQNLLLHNQVLRNSLFDISTLKGEKVPDQSVCISWVWSFNFQKMRPNATHAQAAEILNVRVGPNLSQVYPLKSAPIMPPAPKERLV